MRQFRWLSVFVLVVALGLVAACGSPDDNGDDPGPGDDPTPTPTAPSDPGDDPTPTPGDDFDAEDYFSGRTIQILVGYGAGGGTDGQARMVAQRIGDFIPGNPRIVVSNRPPAIAASNTVWSANPDGLTWELTAQNGIVDSFASGAEFRADEFRYIGGLTTRDLMHFSRSDAPYTNIEDAIGGDETVLYAVGDREETSAVMMTMLVEWLDLPVQRVTGLSGTAAALAALERGDVHWGSNAGWWHQMDDFRPGWFEDGFLVPLLDASVADVPIAPNDALGEVTVPNVVDLIPEEHVDEWEALTHPIMHPGKVIKTTPGTPDEVIAVLRDAFDQAMADEELYDAVEVAGGGIPLFVMDGAETEETIINTMANFEEYRHLWDEWLELSLDRP